MPKLDQATPPSTDVSTPNSLMLPTSPEELQRLQEGGDSDNPDAQFSLGMLYEQGSSALGVDQDEDVAIRWYYLAAKKGHKEAQFSLAYRMHSQLLSAWPTPAYFSSDEVIRWYKAAAEQGHSEAAFQLYLEFAADLEPGDAEQAKYWRDVAISLGYDRDADEFTHGSDDNDAEVAKPGT